MGNSPLHEELDDMVRRGVLTTKWGKKRSTDDLLKIA
jgi:hypothetical protein